MKKYGRRHSQIVIAVIVFVLGLMVLVTMVPGVQAGSRDLKRGVFKPNSNSYGNTYGEWSARWWQWVLSIPEATNPNLDPTGANCAEGQAGQVWFLAGTFGGPATRDCTVPAGRALFFPLLNTVFGAAVGDCEPTGLGPCIVNDLRAGAAGNVDNPKTLEASVDGVQLKNLIDFRVQSPVFLLTLPEDAVFGLPSGTFTPQVSDGYWLMLAPLSPGMHTIHFKGVSNSGGSEVEVTYNLTVGP
jgi:hypothetical protein